MRVASRTALTPTVPPLIQLGDSITWSYGSWFQTAQAASPVVYLAGKHAADGRTVATMLSGIAAATANAPTAAYAIVQGGGNDIRNDSATWEALSGNLEDVFDALSAAGIQPIASTVLPGVPAPTGGQQTAYMGVNAWLRSYCPANDVPLIDWLPAMTTDVDEVLLDASLCVDNYHPNAGGLVVMAAATQAVLDAL